MAASLSTEAELANAQFRPHQASNAAPTINSSPHHPQRSHSASAQGAVPFAETTDSSSHID